MTLPKHLREKIEKEMDALLFGHCPEPDTWLAVHGAESLWKILGEVSESEEMSIRENALKNSKISGDAINDYIIGARFGLALGRVKDGDESESRWANHYFEKVKELETKLQKCVDQLAIANEYLRKYATNEVDWFEDEGLIAQEALTKMKASE
jgi:hypothetical protein